MQIIDGRPVYSATDLVGFLACEHLTHLERAAVAGLTVRPVRDDPELDLIAKRGEAHELRYLGDLRARGLTIREIHKDGSRADGGATLRAAAEDTVAAMRSGVDIIYQATFFDGRWRGHADFLARVESPSELGEWSYQVADTKLARTAKASAILQMCVYTDLVHAVQGVWPEWMEVALGGSARAVERFRVADAMAYYRAVRSRFDAAVDSRPPAWPWTGTYPEPVDHCEVCRWAARCAPQRRADDHLSLVAGITRRQRAGLVEQHIRTVEDLARVPLPMDLRIEGTTAGALERVREQARLQVAGRQADRVLHELLGPIEADRGLALLPVPSPGDLFFDMEGDPFVEDGGADGLEYLFGVIEPGEGLGLDPVFHAFWGRDRAEEKVAFERFVDLVMDRLARHPAMHVYHYAPYEPNAVRRLMGRHATREEEVDRLLRADVFVDLFRVVRQAVRVSTESYSIKRLEPLYGLEREVALRDAGSSIVNFELWLDGGRTDQSLLDLIRAYNRDDCLSNWRLREWLEEQRAAATHRFGVAIPRPVPPEGRGEASAAISERQARVEALVGRLTADLPPARDERTPEQQATWLLAQLIDWHRREDKVHWWNHFAMLEMTPDELVESSIGIGRLTFQETIGQVKRSSIHRYRFPPQDNDISVGATPVDHATAAGVGEVVAIDQVAGVVDLKRSVTSEAPHPSGLVPKDIVPTDHHRDALLELGTWVADHGIDAPGAWRAARDLLLRRPPRAGQAAGAPLRMVGETELEAGVRLVRTMDRSVLAIQGPPGAGKTHTGAHMIVALVRAGKRVGVTANSHRVIGNLLDTVARVAAEQAIDLRIGQKPGLDEPPTCGTARPYTEEQELAGALASGVIHVAGGTTWVWTKPVMTDAVDVLFIDEAGQMALANSVAISRAAGSLVLLGDPQQLEQPIQGTHPPGAEASALEHLLGGRATMPEDLGLFLESTFRMHPAITAFTSELFYEDRLHSEPHLVHQRLGGDDALAGAGLRWLPVTHEGCVDVSAAEADAVVRTCLALLGRSWTDERGGSRQVGWQDIRVLAPYNAQVAAIAERLPPEARSCVGTVDRFQGQTAAVSVYSLTTSSPELAPRGMEFLYSVNRLNVATSRARCVAIVVGSPELLRIECRTPRQVRLANALCRLVEVADPVTPVVGDPRAAGLPLPSA